VLEGQLRLPAPQTTWRKVQATMPPDSLLRIIPPDGGA
jgi:hypothetical protein